jgi:hypothetical protein
MTFWDKVEKACEAVDTWPDWRLDTVSLKARNRRRADGEILPKPTKEQQWKAVADKLAELVESSRVALGSVHYNTTRWNFSDLLTKLEAALAQYEKMK